MQAPVQTVLVSDVEARWVLILQKWSLFVPKSGGIRAVLGGVRTEMDSFASAHDTAYDSFAMLDKQSAARIASFYRDQAVLRAQLVEVVAPPNEVLDKMTAERDRLAFSLEGTPADCMALCAELDAARQGTSQT